MPRYLSSADAPEAALLPERAAANDGLSNPMLHAVRTENDWEYPASANGGAPRPRARFWMGSEISARTFFIVECSVNRDGAAHVKSFVAPSLESAKLYLRDHSSINWSRILVRMRGPVGERYGWKLEELREVYYCPRTGAYVYVLANGTEVLDQLEPATDSRGTQLLDIVYSTSRPYRTPLLDDLL